MICDSAQPGLSNGFYHQPYIEAVEGKDHAYSTRHDGVIWTRNANHPKDGRCPECKEKQMTQLDEIEARADAATKGPWRADGYEVETVTPADVDRFDHMEEMVTSCDLRKADAEFIAHARTDVPKLIAALRAVEAVHTRVGLYEMEDSCPNTDEEHREEHHRECTNDVGEYYCDQSPVGAMCETCSDDDGNLVDWPCPTIQAILEALG